MPVHRSCRRRGWWNRSRPSQRHRPVTGARFEPTLDPIKPMLVLLTVPPFCDRQRAGAVIADSEQVGSGPGRAGAINRRGAGRAGIEADIAVEVAQVAAASGLSACRCRKCRQRQCSLCAPAAPTTVALGATVAIRMSTALVGTPADQLPAVNQSVEVAPVQSVARDGVDVARTSPSATVEPESPKAGDGYDAAKVSAAKRLGGLACAQQRPRRFPARLQTLQNKTTQISPQPR